MRAVLLENLVIILYVDLKVVFLRGFCFSEGVLHGEPGIIPGGGGFRQWFRRGGGEGCGGGRRSDGGRGWSRGEVGSQPLQPKTHDSQAAKPGLAGTEPASDSHACPDPVAVSLAVTASCAGAGAGAGASVAMVLGIH
uniref:Uncharacterized protein n=1 Tax=Anguilla anguilla TaxID=7936 RepID=A0A0E9X9H0_ANGAN